MTLVDQLTEEYPEILGWNVEQGERHEKERINQSTETIKFVATSPDKKTQKHFIYTNFTDHRGSKTSWREESAA
tara:strand:- start:346 stop:567 length:222 start_codon:yes stop_codon:yes gene_type:complete